MAIAASATELAPNPNTTWINVTGTNWISNNIAFENYAPLYIRSTGLLANGGTLTNHSAGTLAKRWNAEERIPPGQPIRRDYQLGHAE